MRTAFFAMTEVGTVDLLDLDVAWLDHPPTPSAPRAKEYELAPGFWIIQEPQWWPASVLDTAVLAPWDDSIEPVHRQFPHPEWHRQALCVGHPRADEIFFGTEDAPGSPSLPPTALREARALCAACPVQRTCLEHALTHPEQFGVWGGTTGRQRAKMQRELRGGRDLQELMDAWLAVLTK